MEVVCNESCQVNCQKTGQVWVATALIIDFSRFLYELCNFFLPTLLALFSYISFLCGTVSLIWVMVGVYQMDFLSQLGFHSSLLTQGLDHTVVQSQFNYVLKVNTASHADISNIHDEANHSNHIFHLKQDTKIHFSQGIECILPCLCNLESGFILNACSFRNIF